MNKNNIIPVSLQALRFLLSPRSLAGLLAANLITLIPFVGGVMYVPLFNAGMDVGAGIIQPVSAESFGNIIILGVIANLLGTLLLAVPVICHLHVKGKADYSDYIVALLKWMAVLCLLASVALVLLTKEINSLMLMFFIFPVVWIPAWMACVAFWRMAVKEPAHNFKTSTKVMLALALLLWFLMSISFGALMATD